MTSPSSPPAPSPALSQRGTLALIPEAVVAPVVPATPALNVNTCVPLVQAAPGLQLPWLLKLLKLKPGPFALLPLSPSLVLAADEAPLSAAEAPLARGLMPLVHVGALGGKLSCEAIILTRRSSRSCSVRAAAWTGPQLPSRVASMSSDDVDGCRWCCVESETAPRSGSSSCHRRLHAAICRPSGTRVQWALSTPRMDGPARSAGVSSSPSLESSEDESDPEPVPEPKPEIEEDRKNLSPRKAVERNKMSQSL